MEGVTIRLAKAVDAGALARHRCEMFSEMGTLSTEAYGPLLAASEAYFVRAIEASRYVSWVAEADGKIVAGGGILVNDIPPRPGPDKGVLRPGPQGLIINIFVEREWRGRGIAQSLVRTMIDFARKAGIPSLVLHASDAGRGLYEKLGFTPTSEMRLFV